MRFNELKYRAKYLYLFFLFLLFILESRIIYLQFFQGDFFKTRAHGNKVKTVTIEPARGNIYDRNGKLLVDNRHAYNLCIVPERFLSSTNSIKFLSEFLKITPDSLLKEIINSNYKPNREVRFRRNIGIKLYSEISERIHKMYGVTLKNEWRRNFNYETAPHLTGYLAEVKYAEQETEFAKIGDLKGKEGVEYIYDKLLRGKKGIKQELRDVKNKKISDWEIENWIKAKEGNQLYLTIDVELQQFIETELLKYSESGSVVVMDCNNGDVLSLISKPDFPLEIFSRSLTYKEWDYWSNHPQKPLYNKAIMGEYPPGSVFKMGSLIAALKQHVTNKNKEVFCPGGMQIGRRFKKCWKHTGHGFVDAVHSLVWSCDTYFYEIAKKIDLDKWNESLTNLGFGNITGIDLRYEKSGFIPDLLYYRKKIKGNLLGRFANLMIGQGEVLTTPLQIANYTAAIANGKYLPQPHVLLKYGKKDNYTFFKDEKNIVKSKLNIKQDILKIVKEGMYLVVNSDTGTGRRSRSKKISFAGKTGTAQNPQGNDHGWFTSYGPVENPQIVVTIFGEHALHGSSLGSLAKKIYEKWLELKENKKALEKF